MITCFIRYEIDPYKAPAFEEYARNWGQAIPRSGADLIGYFAPHEGSSTTAYGVYNIAGRPNTRPTERGCGRTRSAGRTTSSRSESASSTRRIGFSCALSRRRTRPSCGPDARPAGSGHRALDDVMAVERQVLLGQAVIPGSMAALVRRRRLLDEPHERVLPSCDPLILRTKAPDRDGALGRLLAAEDEQHRHLGERMLANLVVDLLVAQVRRDPQARPAGGARELTRVAVRLRGDRRDDDLHRCEPEREVAGVVLDQDAGKALHRAADRPVHHDRRLLSPVGVDVEGAEALRQVEVDLRRAALPVAPDGVAQHVLEFRAVEGALSRVDRRPDPVAGAPGDLLEDARHHGLGVVPHCVRADALLGPGRKLHDDVVLEAEIGVGRENEVVDLQALGGELVLRAEDVRVVLRKGAHAHQPV